ncbi:MAG: hypothetical protein QOJ00_171, partial [Actinomycetota bacterium]
MASTETADVLIVGGGPAGLAAALWLGRHRFDTVVADRGEHRNRLVEASFGYLGFDGQPPQAILDAGRAEVGLYPSVRLITTGVRTVHRHGDAFRAHLDVGVFECAAVIFATGINDGVPALPGLREHYGAGVFVCPLCDGYETQGRHVVVLGDGNAVGQFAAELLQWAARVTVVPLCEDVEANEMPSGVHRAPSAAACVLGTDRVEGVQLVDGSSIACDAIFLYSVKAPLTDLAAALGCDLDADGLVAVDDDGCTSVGRVYAAGDCTRGPQIVQVAA